MMNRPRIAALIPVQFQSGVKQRRRSSRKSRKVMERLRRKSSRGRRDIRYPVVRKMFRVETPWLINNNLQKGQKRRTVNLSSARQWARESLSRRFVLSKQEVDPHQDPSGQVGPPMCREAPSGNTRKIQGRYARLVGDAKVRKKFVRICRGILADLGISLVGPLPFRALEIMWEYFGEEHFTAHGRACWCRLCRSVGPARFSFLQAIGDSLYSYFVSWKFAVSTIFGLIAPAPLRMAKFVSNKLWKWLKILLRD